MLGFSPLADNSIAGFGNIPADVAVTGVAGTSAIGTVTAQGDTNISVTGVAATGEVGVLNIWGEITPSQNSNFSAITPSQTPSWTDIAA